ncbi:MAG: HEAT repeat domain-containing protein [Pseudomonadota bacterium]
MQELTATVEDMASKMANLQAALQEPDAIFVQWMRQINPEVDPAAAAQTMRRFFREQLDQMQEDHPDLALKAYLINLAKKYRWLPFAGLWEHGDPRPLKLDDIFVVPELEQSEQDQDDAAKHEQLKQAIVGSNIIAKKNATAELERLEQDKGMSKDERRATGRSFLDVFTKNHCIVLLGKPGAGKTTLVKWLARSLALHALDDESVARRLPLTQHLVPVVVSIAGFGAARSMKPILSFAEHIRSQLLPLGGQGLLGAVENLLKEGRVFLLVDGLDEVPDLAQRVGVSLAIQEYLLNMPGNRVMITSRIVGYGPCRITEPIPHYILLPFSDKQVEAFARHWYRSLEQTLHQESADLIQAEKDAEALLAEAKHDSIREMLRNPLLLTFAALVRKANIKLPEGRARFYKEVLRKLIERWNLVRSMSGVCIGRELDERAVREAWAPVAYWMHEERPTGFALREHIQEHLEQAFVERLDYRRHEARETAYSYLQTAVETIGLVEPRGQDHLAFAHQTFQEYLAAQELCTPKAKAPERALAKSLDPRWSEVIRLAAGYLDLLEDKPLVSALVRALLEEAPPMAMITGRGLELAIGIVTDGVALDRAAQNLLASTLLVTWEKHAHIAGHLGLSPSIAALGVLSTPADLEETLVAACDHDDWQIRLLACLGLGRRSSLLPASLVQLSKSLDDNSESVRLAAALALLEHKDVTPKQAVILSQGAFNQHLKMQWAKAGQKARWDRDQLVKWASHADLELRLAAISILLSFFPDTTDQVNALSELIAIWLETNVPNWSINQRFYPLRSDIPGFVQALISLLTHVDAHVRLRAAQELSLFSRETPGLIEAVSGLLSHKDPDVRLFAIDKLSRLNHETPGLVEAVSGLLSHGDPNVQLRAAETLNRIRPESPVPVEALSEMLSQGNAYVQWRAVETLSRLRPETPGLAEVVSGLLSHGDSELRLWAIDKLSRLSPQTPAVVEAVSGLLSHGDSELRLWAAITLNRIRPESPGLVEALIRLLSHEDTNVRVRAAEAFSKLRPDTLSLVKAVVELLTHGDANVRLRLPQLLKKLRPDTPGLAKALSDLLSHENANTRLRATKVLSKFRPDTPGLVEAVSGLLSHSDINVQVRAAEVLSNFRPDTPGLAEILSKLLKQVDTDVLFIAIEALSKLRPYPPGLIEAWSRLFAHEDINVRLRAIFVFSKLRPFPPGLAEEMNDLLSYLGADELLTFAEVLTYLRPDTPGLVEAVSGLLSHGDSEIRLRVVETLSQLRPETPGLLEALIEPLSQSNADVQLRAVEVLSRLRPDLPGRVEALSEMLSQGNADVQWRAVEALSRMGPNSSVFTNVRIGLPKYGDVNNWLRAAWFLSEFRPDALGLAEALSEMLSQGDNRLRGSAFRILNKLRPFAPGLAEAWARQLGSRKEEKRILVLLAKVRTGEELTRAEAEDLMDLLAAEPAESAQDINANEARVALHGLTVTWLESQGAQACG